MKSTTVENTLLPNFRWISLKIAIVHPQVKFKWCWGVRTCRRASFFLESTMATWAKFRLDFDGRLLLMAEQGYIQ